MASSQPMSVLSPEKKEIPIQISGNETSKLTTQDLSLLNDPQNAHLLAMAVIAHVDLNAFYAQCEQLRLGKTFDDPVVCAQWQSLIAVSYAARKYGIGRMDTLESALKKCPGLVVGHAAVFKKGDSHWQYLNKLPDQGIHKVSLDPYRRELRKIIGILARECDVTEKASVDECYLDLGRLVYTDMMELFPGLNEHLERYSHARDHVPLPPLAEMCPLAEHLPGQEWVGRIYETDAEAAAAEPTAELEERSRRVNCSIPPQISDWDDVAMLIASRHLSRIRRCIYDELGYTTSGGLSQTKSVAKLAGGFNKPDFQTVIRPAAVFRFFSNFGLGDFTMMGGKTGEVILERLGVPADANSIAWIRSHYSHDELRSALGADDGLASKVYELVTATHRQELKRRTVVKSMMSRKNFVSTVATLADAFDWIKVFAGDLYGRLTELDDENMNLSLLQSSHHHVERHIYRPRTVSVQVTTQLWVKHLRQMQFIVVKQLDRFKQALENTAFRLLVELMAGTKAAELNPGIDLRRLRSPTAQDLTTIAIPALANMGLVVLNFVKTSDANLIDSYGAGDVSAKETIRSMFDEVREQKEQQQREEQQREQKEQKKTDPQNDTQRDYVEKLFKDFEAESASTVTSTVAVPAKPSTALKQRKDDVARLFAQYHKERSPVAPTTKKETTSKQAREKTPEEDPLLRELIKNQYCSSCDTPVTDVFEHKDLHVAMELSLRLNGTPPKRKKPNTLRQSQLPF